jgi:hypothetical protein
MPNSASPTFKFAPIGAISSGPIMNPRQTQTVSRGASSLFGVARAVTVVCFDADYSNNLAADPPCTCSNAAATIAKSDFSMTVLSLLAAPCLASLSPLVQDWHVALKRSHAGGLRVPFGASEPSRTYRTPDSRATRLMSTARPL